MTPRACTRRIRRCGGDAGRVRRVRLARPAKARRSLGRAVRDGRHGRPCRPDVFRVLGCSRLDIGGVVRAAARGLTGDEGGREVLDRFPDLRHLGVGRAWRDPSGPGPAAREGWRALVPRADLSLGVRGGSAKRGGMAARAPRSTRAWGQSRVSSAPSAVRLPLSRSGRREDRAGQLRPDGASGGLDGADLRRLLAVAEPGLAPDRPSRAAVPGPAPRLSPRPRARCRRSAGAAGRSTGPAGRGLGNTGGTTHGQAAAGRRPSGGRRRPGGVRPRRSRRRSA